MHFRYRSEIHIVLLLTRPHKRLNEEYGYCNSYISEALLYNTQIKKPFLELFQ